MALRISEQIDRVTRFMRGATQPRISAALAQYGFAQKALDEGWEHLRAVIGHRVDVRAAVPVNPDDLTQLDLWENRWYPVIEAALKYRYPSIHAEVFYELSQTDGPHLLVSVPTLLSRIDKLKQGDAEHKAAHAQLEQRGVSADVLKEARGLIDRMSKLQPAPASDPESSRPQRDAAVQGMWNWYREWRAIARAAISDGRLLAALGLGPVRGRGGSETTEDAEDNAVPPPDPQAPTDRPVTRG